MKNLISIFMCILKYIKYDDVKKMYLLRNMYNICNNSITKFIFKRLYDNLMKRNCASIPIELNIFATFPHGLSGIFISKKAKIGKECVIFQQVTIGSNMLNNTKHRGAPSIGNSVYICSGAKIIGNVHVEDNVRIGANAVVYENIPYNSTVVLGKNRIIPKKHMQDNKFIDISYL